MHREDFEEFRRQQAEEEFFRLAALEIENEENEEFWKAQDQPDPPPEVMERLHAHLQADMRRAGRKTRRRRALKQLAQMAACLAIVCCVGFTGVYLTVDAARTAINNFVLEMFDGRKIAAEWRCRMIGRDRLILCGCQEDIQRLGPMILVIVGIYTIVAMTMIICLSRCG